jgi:hypothetical protein
MSSDADGVMIVSEGGVYFVPLDDLDAYRLPDDVAKAARTQFAADQATDSGTRAGADSSEAHRPSPAVVAPVRWPRQSITHDIMLHTATRW